MNFNHVVLASLLMTVAASAVANPLLRYSELNRSIVVTSKLSLPNLPANVAEGDNKVGEIYSDWRPMGVSGEGDPYNCSNMLPMAADIPQGEAFTQTGDCLVDRQSQRDVFFVYESGQELFATREFDAIPETVTRSQQAVGERYQVGRAYAGQSSRITGFCTGVNYPSRHYKSVRSFYDVFNITFSNGEVEQELESAGRDERVFWTNDRAVCVVGTQGL